MIAIDTSAIIAIMLAEPDADMFARLIAGEEHCLISTVSVMEASIVLAGRTGSADRWRELDELLLRLGIEVVPQTMEHVDAAREAYVRFGKGRHSAALNMGDCAAYALAKVARVPLLYKGGDFSQTDIRSAR